jgi:AcrR family transcriptional regulator
MNQHIPTVADWPHASDVSGDRHALRAQRTRELMLVTMYHLALEKDYCDITVQDLLDRSGVARSTFYTHFRDKEDLLVAGYGVMGAPAIKLSNVAGRQRVVLDVCEWLFVATEQHAALTTSLMSGTSREIVLAHLENLMIVQVREHLKAHRAYCALGLRGEIAVRSLVGGLLGLWSWWVRHDYPCAAKDLSETFNTVMIQGIWPETS